MREIGGGMGRMLLDLCFPPHCAGCEAQVEAAGNLCSPCFTQLRQIAAPMCSCCGMPFANPVEVGLCANCASQHPLFVQARAAWVYNEVSGTLVRRLKFHDRTAMLPRYGKALAVAGREMLQESDVAVPVPLHWRRLLKRRYNQSALLAFALAREVEIPVLVGVLRRIRHTVPQTRLKGEERRKNVKGAFAVREPERIRGKRVLLIDDVMTTGATILASTDALLRAGAQEVRVLTLARTLRE